MTRPSRSARETSEPRPGAGHHRKEGEALSRLASILFRTEEMAVLMDELIEAGPACGTGDTELFTGPDADETDKARLTREATARGICASCPAQAACLAYALALRPEVGIWAGWSAEEIDRLASLAGRGAA